MTKPKRDKLIRKLEADLDKAVYELFDLTDAERERVEEFRDIDIDLFYRGMDSKAVRPLDWPDRFPTFGRLGDLAKAPAKRNELGRYLETFIDIWETQLQDQHGRLRWRVIKPADVSSMTAVIFETETAAEPLLDPTKTDSEEWESLLVRLDKSVLVPTKSKRVYIDGLIRIVSESEIAIIKRNEHRLWTRSAARDDAEASMVLAIQLSEQTGVENP